METASLYLQSSFDIYAAETSRVHVALHFLAQIMTGYFLFIFQGQFSTIL